MNITIASINLKNEIGGVQTWARTLRNAFNQMGHTVFFFDKHSRSLHKSDKIFVTHFPILSKILRYKRKIAQADILYMTHGVINRLAVPIAGAGKYLAVSEETRDLVTKHGFDCTSIVRNPINVDIFSNVGCEKKCKMIAIIRKGRPFRFTSILKDFNVIEVNKHNPTTNIRAIIEPSDLVIAVGRTAYEAMAMGKNVIISGENGLESKHEFMDGFIDANTFFEFRKNNCSGRNRGIPLTADILIQEVAKYSHEQGQINTALITEHNHYFKIAESLLEV